MAEANHGLEMAVRGELDSNLPAFLDADNFDEGDMKFPRSPMEPRIPYEEIKWFEVATNANTSTRRDSDLPARPHFRIQNAGEPPNQLFPPALLQDQRLWPSENPASSGSSGSSTTNIRPSLSYPWSVRDNNPRDFALPHLTLTAAFSQLRNLVPASARPDRERRLNRAQRREPAAIRIKTCKHCGGVYVWGSRRLHDKSHCMAFEKENIDPN
ncbi:hypothetical protein PLEOSDRAFT_1102818 [Pleurotus ostreatus PC15]|uniref:Uncharacterized protein n=1 Tax=Pleurotus ostreatus (strain PC15) TaxID=1137138 RepID=A0A067NXC8_PLEO1|nr:hypothetical protein PLEOSDRAFT_1102818 [Pleurotus ostreatus PC15]